MLADLCNYYDWLRLTLMYVLQ